MASNGYIHYPEKIIFTLENGGGSIIFIVPSTVQIRIVGLQMAVQYIAKPEISTFLHV